MVYASSTVTKRNNINQREKRKLKASLLGVANNNSERKKNYYLHETIAMCVYSSYGCILQRFFRMAGMHTIQEEKTNCAPPSLAPRSLPLFRSVAFSFTLAQWFCYSLSVSLSLSGGLFHCVSSRKYA